MKAKSFIIMSEKPRCDIFRDTWVRYLGYANEVGEAFRPVVPSALVRFSYGIAFSYVVGDTMDKGVKMFIKGCGGLLQEDGRPRNVMIATGDAFLWQTFASIIIPGITINRLCAYTGRTLTKFKKIPGPVRAMLTVGIGLASIPVIIVPIDHGVTFLMDHTYRKWVN